VTRRGTDTDRLTMFVKWLKDLWGETVERWLFLTGLSGACISLFSLNPRFSILHWTAVGLAIVSFGLANFKLYKKLHESLADEKSDERRRNFKVSVSVSGNPPSQSLDIKASETIEISRVAYLLMSGTTLATDDLALKGETISVEINEGHLPLLWNTYRPERNPTTFAGPIKIRLTIHALKRVKNLDLTVTMDTCVIEKATWKILSGSETFYGI
jgi:hypothetical protein